MRVKLFKNKLVIIAVAISLFILVTGVINGDAQALNDQTTGQETEQITEQVKSSGFSKRSMLIITIQHQRLSLLLIFYFQKKASIQSKETKSTLKLKPMVKSFES